jgi:hypothetical protein
MIDFLTAEHWQRLFKILKVIATIGGVVGAIVWLKRGVTGSLALTRKRQLANLKQRRDWLRQLHDCDRAYYGYLLSGILSVLVWFAMQLILEGMMVSLTYSSPFLQQVAAAILTMTRYGVGLIAGAIAMRRLGTCRVLQHFDPAMAALDRCIATLEAKLGVSPASATVTEAVPCP